MNTIQSDWLAHGIHGPFSEDERQKARRHFYAGSAAMFEAMMKLEDVSGEAFHHIMAGYEEEIQMFKREQGPS